MNPQADNQRFSFAPLTMLFLPHVGIAYFCDRHDVWTAGMIAVGMITGLCVLLFIVRNFADLVAGILGSLLLLAILSACAMIPVVGWIADVLILLYALGSVLSSIGTLMPYAVKALAIWAVFLVSLLPAIFHPVISPAVVCLVALGLGSAVAKKSRPFDEFVLLMASIPLLSMAIVSLGKLFQSGIAMRNVQVRQNVSGYTTQAGAQVDAYTRVVTKTIPQVTTSINPGAVAAGSAAGQGAKDETNG